jgi:hypothetical protein
MAHLPAAVRNQLRLMYTNNESINPNRVGDFAGVINWQVACYNWALTGGVQTLSQMVSPQVLCDHVTQGALGLTVNRYGNALEKGWYAIPANRTALETIKQDWTGGNKNAAALLDVSQRLARLAIEANGLRVSAAATGYKIGVYYYDTETLPSFQHWWIEVEEMVIETFPGLDDITIADDPQDLDGHDANGVGHIYFYFNIEELHQRQVDHITRRLFPPIWQPDNTALRCSNQACARQFGLFTRRHHCRLCGKIFCDNCSSQRKLVALVVARPGQAPRAGRVRVCDNCASERPG